MGLAGSDNRDSRLSQSSAVLQMNSSGETAGQMEFAYLLQQQVVSSGVDHFVIYPSPKDFPIPISISSIWIILSKYKKEKKESSINPRIIPRGYNDSPSNRRNFVPAVIREKLLIYSFVRVLSTVYKNALRAIALDRSPRSFDPIHARAHHGRTPVEEGVGAGWCAATTGKPRRRVV